MTVPLLIAAGAGYFLGALPFGWLVARAHGVDIFKAGSGNPGATNVKRVLGRRAGNTVFALDFLKGAVAAGWPLLLASATPAALQIAGLAGAIVGHTFSLFTRFKGGKGVATAGGGLLVLVPWAAVAGVAAWGAVFYATRYVSLASIAAAVVLPLTAWLFGYPLASAVCATALGVFVILRHRANLVRLCQGTEHKFARKPPEANP